MIINVAKLNIKWTDYDSYRDYDDYESADDIGEKTYANICDKVEKNIIFP